MDPILEAGLRELAAGLEREHRMARESGTARDSRLAQRLVDPGAQGIGDRLTRYMEELELFNPAYGLVAVADRRELAIKHILDSLAPLGVIDGMLAQRRNRQGAERRPMRIADAGSGAGLPGIPLALALPECEFTLIERMGRRVGFLENTLAVLGIRNAAVEQSDAEKASPGRFDLVVFRAFRPLEPPMLKALFRLLSEDGILGAYKAREDKIKEEMDPIAGLTGGWEVFETPVPFLEEGRRFVVVRPLPRRAFPC